MIEEEIITSKPVEEWEPIPFDIDKINIAKLARKHAFYNGTSSELTSAERSAADMKAKRETAPRFDKVGDVLPIEFDHEGDEESKGVSFKDIAAGSVWNHESAA
jgi:diacylglycerol kinase (ATP)